MQRLKRKLLSERGGALILFTLMLVIVILPMIGLAIDGGITYLAQSRLYSAVDAASLAGGRSLNVGMDFTSQKANAETTARNYFYANFPTGLLNTTNATVTATAAENSDHTRTVSVTANASVNLYFMKMLDKPTALVSTTAQSSRRDVNVVLVLDRSGSMSSVCSTLIGNAQSFVDKFSNGRDTVGLVTFMGSANTDYGSTINFKTQTPTLSAKLGTLQCGGGTASADALSLARIQMNSQNLPGAQNIIVFFTDGQPTVVSSPPANASVAPYGLPVKKGSSCGPGYGKYIVGSLAESTASTDLGVYYRDPVSITTTSNALVPNSNCYYSSYSGSYVDRDIDYVPDSDYYGNSTSGYTGVTKGTAGDGKQHITVTGPNIEAAATNAADNIANTIRNDGTVIYTIGLGSNGGVDDTFLRRVANDTASNAYNSAQPTGKYYYSPDASQLATAFNAVSSQILRLSR